MKPLSPILLSPILLAAWLALGGAVEAGQYLDREIAKKDRATAAQIAEMQHKLERQQNIADRNLWQAERFIIMCLDPAMRYAYLGDIVIECKAKVTKHKLIL